MKPIAVLISAYNEEDFIVECVQSVLRQTKVGLVHEVVIVDDGSEDATPRLIDQLACSHNIVRTIRQRNQGLAAARNTGLTQSEGEWVCFLDGDDKWAADKLEQQWAAATEKEEIALWYTDTRKFGDEERRVRVRGLPEDRQQALIEYFRRDCPIIPSTVMVRRNAFRQVGMFDPELRYAQDTEMWARIIASYSVRRLPEPLVFRRAHSGSLSSDFFTKVRYKKRVSKKLVRRYPVLRRHEGYRYARLQFSIAMRHLEDRDRLRAILRAKKSLASHPAIFEAYVILVCALIVPFPDVVLRWAGKTRGWFRDRLGWLT